MKIIDAVKLSFSVLRTNKVRSFLTSLGVIIGIASVIVIMSVGAGAQSLIINQLNSIGSNLVSVLPGASDANGPPASALGIVVTTLKYEDAVAIMREVPNVEAASSYNSGIATVSYQNQTTDANFFGVMSAYTEVENAQVAVGRFFTSDEEDGSGRLVVLGYQVWQDLFGDENPIGRKIKIKKDFFEVIGVMDKRGSSGFQNQDDLVLMPVSTAQNMVLGISHVNAIRIKVADASSIDQVVSDITLLLRDRHDIRPGEDDDFSVRNMRDAISALTNITDAIKFFLAAIAGIALIVGGVGVMNIMLASVNERIREIGLRKAVGANKFNIILQFILETMAITIVGGILGILIGSFISALVALVAQYLGYQWDFVITLNSILLGVGVSAVVGFIFGIYPAKKASELDPITALRYE